MSSPNHPAPTPDEMASVTKAMIAAWQSGVEYVAASRDTYFRCVVPVLRINGAVRIVSETIRTNSNGNEVMMDTYRVPDGRTIRVGYQSDEAGL